MGSLTPSTDSRRSLHTVPAQVRVAVFQRLIAGAIWGTQLRKPPASALSWEIIDRGPWRMA